MPASIGVNLRVTGHCSQGGRKYMEDFFSVAYQQSEDEKDLEYAFFGIYDGHGGSEAATYAKEHLMNLIVNQKLFWSDNDSDILRAIREGYIATHNAMWREQEKWPKTPTGLPSTAGTTASVAFIRHGKIYIGHVGDSGIVLGYQDEGDSHWKAKPLTQDHKPECNIEKARIINSGGKVITKSGVPRVVWTRPRLGHKGPVRRSTPIDEIPFLAVARSLGDLWSYNSELNEFVVSPDPDVLVIKIDPKKFRCLIFGTDGLWNVLSANAAVEVVHGAEQINDRNLYANSSKDWTNPSKSLVDKALERWSTTKMRADNTSVVTIMLDPPGPPKRELLRSCPNTYSLDYVPYIQQAEEKSITMFDHSNRVAIDLDHIPMPTNGVAVMMRIENHGQMPYDHYIDQQSIANCNPHEITYMNSFAESYNSLLNSSYEDHSYIAHPQQLDHNDHTFIPQQNEDTYSLTKLETRLEQMTSTAAEFGEPSGINRYHNYHTTSYRQEHHYLGKDHQFNNISSSYELDVLESVINQEKKEASEIHWREFSDLAEDDEIEDIEEEEVDEDEEEEEDEEIENDDNKEEIENKMTSITTIYDSGGSEDDSGGGDDDAESNVVNDISFKCCINNSDQSFNPDESIQINEISSSVAQNETAIDNVKIPVSQTEDSQLQYQIDCDVMKMSSSSSILKETDDSRQSDLENKSVVVRSNNRQLTTKFEARVTRSKYIDLNKSQSTLHKERLVRLCTRNNMKPTSEVSENVRLGKRILNNNIHRGAINEVTTTQNNENSKIIRDIKRENITNRNLRTRKNYINFGKSLATTSTTTVALRSRNTFIRPNNDVKIRKSTNISLSKKSNITAENLNVNTFNGSCSLRTRHFSNIQQHSESQHYTRLSRNNGSTNNNNNNNNNNSDKLQSQSQPQPPLSTSSTKSSLSPKNNNNQIMPMIKKMSKRLSSKNSVWCPGKTAVQTRNRVQKRLSH